MLSYDSGAGKPHLEHMQPMKFVFLQTWSFPRPFLCYGKILNVVKGTTAGLSGCSHGGPDRYLALPLEAVTSGEGLADSGPQLAHLQNGDNGTSLQGLLWGSVR